MEARLGGADRNLQNRGTLFEREVVLIAEQEYGSAGGRDVVEQGQECLVGWLAEIGVEGSELFRWCIVEGLPAAGMFQMREGNTRSDPEGPGRKTAGSRRNGSLRKIWSEVSCRTSSASSAADETRDVAAQRRIGVTEKLFQCGPVASLRKKDQQGLVGRRGLLRLSSGMHA